MKVNWQQCFYRYYLFGLAILLFYPTLLRVSEKPRGVIWSDCEGYYMYLPAVFIQHDVHKMQHGSIVNTTNKDGEFVNKFTCGVALLELPFFLITREYAKQKALPVNDYFGNHYAYGIAIGGYLIGFLGLFFLQKGLLYYYSPFVTLLTVMGVFLGTNLFHYTTKEMGMSHVYSFMLISFLVWKVPVLY